MQYQLFPLLKMPGKRTANVTYRISPETKIMLEKLAKIHGTSSTAIFESLVIERSKEFGLIKSR